MEQPRPLVVSLTTIPPRFGQLPKVVAALRAQRRPADQIILCLPETYRRFPGRHKLPELPGVSVLRPHTDPGPVGKLTLAARTLRGQDCQLLYCDDDWLYGPGWTWAFTQAARNTPEAVICASGFSARRLGLTGAKGRADIAQGFAGVLLRPDWLDDTALAPPPEAWAVDDIWLSAQYARLGRKIIQPPGLRVHASPLPDPGRLQDTVLDGENRAESNHRLAHRLATEYRIWGA